VVLSDGWALDIHQGLRQVRSGRWLVLAVRVSAVRQEPQRQPETLSMHFQAVAVRVVRLQTRQLQTHQVVRQ
jgi:hypothetical protein